jgi:hypothetical protein
MNSSMRLARGLGILVAVVVGTAAAAVPAAAAGKADRPESCRLLRAAEITEAFAQPTSGATPGHAPLLCDWSLSATDTRGAAAISVFLKRGDDATDDYSLARGFHREAQIKLRGLGRRAFYAPDLETVYVLEDPATIFFVQGLFPSEGLDAAGVQSALVELAGKASRRV